MKKRLSLILCVVLLCQLLSGCGKTTETVREPDDAYRCYYEIFVGSFCDSDGDGIGDFRGAEAPSYGMPITKYDARSTGAESYRLLAEEVINRGNEEEW